jgi:hypothetical protein
MNIVQLKERLLAGEDSEHQFKENFSSIDQLASEITAFANSQGAESLSASMISDRYAGFHRKIFGD